MVAVPPNVMPALTDFMTVDAADLTPIVGNVNDVYNNQLNNGYGTIYTAPTTIPVGTWTLVPPTLAQGSALGLSLSGNLFTLSAGVWDVHFNFRSTRTNTIPAEMMGIAIATNAAAGDTTILDGMIMTAAQVPVAGDWFLRCHQTFISNGTQTVSFKWLWSSGAGAAPSTPSRISFMRLAPA
jgi:hypothetical protein